MHWFGVLSSVGWLVVLFVVWLTLGVTSFPVSCSLGLPVGMTASAGAENYGSQTFRNDSHPLHAPNLLDDNSRRREDFCLSVCLHVHPLPPLPSLLMIKVPEICHTWSTNRGPHVMEVRISGGEFSSLLFAFANGREDVVISFNLAVRFLGVWCALLRPLLIHRKDFSSVK